MALIKLCSAHTRAHREAQIFVEKASGARHERPVLEKVLASLEKGDTLAVWKLDRLGRSLTHLVTVMEDLDRGRALYQGQHRQAGAQHPGIDRPVRAEPHAGAHPRGL